MHSKIVIAKPLLIDAIQLSTYASATALNECFKELSRRMAWIKFKNWFVDFVNMH